MYASRAKFSWSELGLLILTVALVVIGISLSSCGVSPAVRAAASQEGLASYYSYEFQGRKTSNGETFNTNAFTAAHRSYPFNTKVRVTNLATQSKVDVRINDRGPMKPERVIDLTLAAAKAIGLEKQGVGRVRLEVIEWGK